MRPLGDAALLKEVFNCVLIRCPPSAPCVQLKMLSPGFLFLMPSQREHCGNTEGTTVFPLPLWTFALWDHKLKLPLSCIHWFFSEYICMTQDSFNKLIFYRYWEVYTSLVSYQAGERWVLFSRSHFRDINGTEPQTEAGDDAWSLRFECGKNGLCTYKGLN